MSQYCVIRGQSAGAVDVESGHWEVPGKSYRSLSRREKPAMMEKRTLRNGVTELFHKL